MGFMYLPASLARWQGQSLWTRCLLASVVVLTIIFFSTRNSNDVAKYVIKTPPPPTTEENKNAGGPWEFVVDRDGDNHGLSEEQCRTAFPKLYSEIDKSTAFREKSPIKSKELDSIPVEDGMVRALIHHGELYIIEYGKVTVTFTRGKATLNSLNRALAAFPDRQNLPNVEFTFTTEDMSRGESPIWSYSKRDDEEGVWLMPDFGYWSWPEVNVGAYKDIRQRIAAVDDGGLTATGKVVPGLRFKDKKKQLFWRGSVATNEALRGKLMEASNGKSWSSVRQINWGDPDDVRENLLPMEDHCRYMFLGHIEGRSFSGRGKYLMNCRSVVITHHLVWREAHHAALVSSGPEANFVEVDDEFSDLDRKMNYLLDNPEVAERIANNAVKTLRDRYLTPAAESCYWRHLVRQYASVCDFEPDLYEKQSDGKIGGRGEHFESWILTPA